MALEGPETITNYVSNGISGLPMVISVQDQAGNNITSGSFCDSIVYAAHTRRDACSRSSLILDAVQFHDPQQY